MGAQTGHATEEEAKRAAALLSQIMERELGVQIHPTAMKIFVEANWSRLSPLAHKIHDAVETRDHARREYDRATNAYATLPYPIAMTEPSDQEDRAMWPFGF